jgi:hypothetical protein
MNLEILIVVGAVLFGFLFPWDRYPKAKLVFIGLLVLAVIGRAAFKM